MKTNIAILWWEKLNFTRNIARDKERYFIMIKVTTFTNFCAINNTVSHCIKQKLTELKIEIAICTVIFVFFFLTNSS